MDRVIFIVASLCLVASSVAVHVKITQDGPAVHGSTVSFKAELLDDETNKPSGTTTKHKFVWRDDAMPPHQYSDEGEFTTSLWNVTYAGHDYPPGQYEVEVDVKRWVGFFYWDIASSRIIVNVTALLNGQMKLVQNGTQLTSSFVSQPEEVVHRIQLNAPDAAVLSANGTVINTYWFVGCEYFGSTQDLSFPFNYTKDDTDKVKVIRALVVGGKETENNTIEETNFFGDPINVTDGESTTARPDHNCDDFPVVPKDPSKYYGYFKHNVIPTAPVQVNKPEGATWLRTGEVLHLNVTCAGSSPFYYCIQMHYGEYNATGNETCVKPKATTTCKVSYVRLMNSGTKFTFVFIIGNRVSNVVTPVGITRYSEKHHPQLSVVIVPITCSVLAIVSIIFGVAYYIQSRNRFKIEVADFDFSRNSDTEYKSFKERLREAVITAFTRVKDDEYSDDGPSHYSGGGGGVWSPTRKTKPPREGNLLYENSDSDH